MEGTTEVEPAVYQIGPERHYRSGRFYAEGDRIALDPDEAPSHTFMPLNETAVRAWQKAWGKPRSGETKRVMRKPATVATDLEVAPNPNKVPGAKDNNPA